MNRLESRGGRIATGNGRQPSSSTTHKINMNRSSQNNSPLKHILHAAKQANNNNQPQNLSRRQLDPIAELSSLPGKTGSSVSPIRESFIKNTGSSIIKNNFSSGARYESPPKAPAISNNNNSIGFDYAKGTASSPKNADLPEFLKNNDNSQGSPPPPSKTSNIGQN